jgi:acetyl esterase
VQFPVPHDDVVAAWRWVTAEADRLGVDRARLCLAGASAGGNLAAGAALRVRDDGDELQPAWLLLAYAVLHAVLPSAPGALAERLLELPPALRFPPADIERANTNYVGGAPAQASAYAFPALGDLAGLPPTLILNSEYDDLRASGEAFASALAEAGVPVRLHREPGATHGHLNRPGLPGTHLSLAVLADWLSPGAAR